MKTREQINVETGVVYVGIDVSKDTLAVDAGEFLSETIENNRKSISKLIGRLRKKSQDGIRFRFCLEQTGCYGLRVRLVLDELGQSVCALDPAKIRHYAKACGIAAKTDPIDAAVIRRYAEQTEPEPTPLPSATRLALREIVRTRGLLVQAKGSFQRQLEATDDPTCRDVLKRTIQSLDTKIGKLEAKMTQTASNDPATKRTCDILQGVVGVGPLTAVVVTTLVPELGSLGRQRAASIAGLAPHPRESGTFKGRRKTGGGRRDVRTALYMPAMVAIRHDDRLKAYYTHLRNDLHKPFRVAMVAAMRKLFVRMDAVVAAESSSSAE